MEGKQLHDKQLHDAYTRGKMQKSKNSAENETTFYLHYTDGTNHRYDNIRKSTTTGDKFKFPIEANHLYCLGAKSTTVNQPYDLKEYYEPVMTDVKIEIEPAFEKNMNLKQNKRYKTA